MLLDVLIVEDNDAFLNVNLKYIQQLARKYSVGLNVKSFSFAGENLAQFIRENRIDVALLDIEVGKRNGIAIGREIIQYHPLVDLIFITAFGENIKKANKLSPVGFLDKPVDLKAFEKIFYRVIMEKWGRESMENSNARVLTVRRNRENIELKESEILYIRTDGRKILVATKNGPVFMNGTITALENEVSNTFVRVCRDIIVNKREVIRLVKGCITVSNNENLAIPAFKHKEIVQKIRS